METLTTEKMAFELFNLTEQNGIVTIDFSVCTTPFLKENFVRDMKLLLDYLEDESNANTIIFKGMSLEFADGLELPDFDFFRRWEKMLNQLSKLQKVTIAVIDAECERLLMQLALSCNYRLATPEASFIVREIKEGYLPGMALFYLTKYLGLGLAKRMILIGEPMSAQKALENGMIDDILSKDILEEQVLSFVDQISSQHAKAFQLGARLINECYSSSYESALGHYLAAQNKCLDELANAK